MAGLVRLASAGSVDDGKSTLIGRLLLETDSLYEDQLLEIDRASARSGATTRDLAFVTDGLREERNRNITIDVAYRPLRTARRRFILADCPGHAEYTRNMVTAASTADLMIVLLDASRGPTSQSRRHIALASLLGTPVLLAINKMDLVGFEREAFEALRNELTEFGNRLGCRFIGQIPISAFLGDNVVTRSEQMPWYEGLPLLEILESFELPPPAATPLRLPVQNVLQDGFVVTGALVGSALSCGDLLESPSGQTAQVKALWIAGEQADSAPPGSPVSVELANPVELKRGDWLHRPGEQAKLANRFTATLFWIGASPLQTDVPYLLRQGPRLLPATIREVSSVVNLDTGAPHPAASVESNDIALVEIELERETALVTYVENRDLGSFILLAGKRTVAAGTVAKIPAPSQVSS